VELSVKDAARAEAKKSGFFRFLVFCSGALAAIDIGVTAHTPLTDTIVKTSMGILAASSVIFVVNNVLLAWFNQAICSPAKFLTLVREETWFELVCLVYGWVLLGTYPIMAPFRYLRIVRIFWDYEFYFCEHGSGTYTIAANIVYYLESVARELGSAKATKGGLIVLAMFFYLVYMFAAVFVVETADWQNWEGNPGANPPWWVPNSNAIPCDTLAHCYITLLRISFYDGNGFDFMTNLANSPNPALFALSLLYLCLSGILLFNGLIGIYGGAFVVKDAEEEDKEEDAKEPKEALAADIQGDLDKIKERLEAVVKRNAK